MALTHATSGQPIDVRPYAEGLRGATTQVLFKTDRLEVFRMVLHAGKATPSHRVPGPLTVQCLEGRVELAFDGLRSSLGPGQLVGLDGGQAHALVALEDSSVLVTLVLKGP